MLKAELEEKLSEANATIESRDAEIEALRAEKVRKVYKQKPDDRAELARLSALCKKLQRELDAK